MIRTILSKEWHEHRTRYASYWLTLMAPVIILCLAIAFSTAARTPFADLSNATVWKYLPLSLAESVLLATLFMIASGHLAVATFSPEIEDRSLFFVFEQPIPRKQYVAFKLLNGGIHVVAATCLAGLLAPTAVYAMMLVSGKVTWAGSAAAFSAVLAASARAAIWCALLALLGFAASALVSTVAPRWWLAAIGSILLIVFFGYFSGDFFFDFFPPETGEPISVGASVSTNSSNWVTISRAVTPAELHAFGHWKPMPLLIAALLVAIFCAAVAFLYDRKELK